jgi:pyruvate formate lyase activating enzyme
LIAGRESLTVKVPYVFNVQRFSVHDGPGLRTAVFFKGCPLRCPWCHNPESQVFGPEVMVSLGGRRQVVGRAYSVDELVEECSRDILFYDQSGGGVTFTGGEAMAQDLDYLLELATKLRAKGINVGVDTCGVAAQEAFAQMARQADFFLYDLKFIDAAKHREFTGASNALVLKNLELLASLGAVIYLRMILLEGLNADPDTIEATMLWLKNHHIELAGVNLLPYHRFGMDKFAKLGREATEFTTPGPDQLAEIIRQVARYYPGVTIGG